MRGIKFRGKRVDNGEWAYGGVDIKIYGSFIERGNLPFDHEVRVFPETVGEFTGLHDKYGKEIYEDDIVKLCDTNPVLFKIERHLARYGYKFVFIHLDDKTVAHGYFLDKCEVIGNIHDNNLELLQGEATTNASQVVHLP